MAEEQQVKEKGSKGAPTPTQMATTKLSPGKLLSFVGGLAWLLVGILPGDIPYNTLMWVLCRISSAQCGGLPTPGYEFRGRAFCLLFSAVLLLISTPAVVSAIKQSSTDR